MTHNTLNPISMTEVFLTSIIFLSFFSKTFSLKHTELLDLFRLSLCGLSLLPADKWYGKHTSWGAAKDRDPHRPDSESEHASMPIKSSHAKSSHYVTPGGIWDPISPVTGWECGTPQWVTKALVSLLLHCAAECREGGCKQALHNTPTNSSGDHTNTTIRRQQFTAVCNIQGREEVFTTDWTYTSSALHVHYHIGYI